MNLDIFLILYFSLFVAVHGSSSPVLNISERIFSNYDSSFRPVCSGVNQVNATIGVAVRQVIDLDEPNQILKLNLYMQLKWNDCLLTWNPSDYDGIGNIIVPYKKVWVPDLTLYDSIATEFHGLTEFRPNIYSDGSVYYNFPTVIEALCPIDVTSFPFDTQVCELVFGSWAYHGLSLDFAARSPAVDLSNIKENVEWDVVEVTSQRHVLYYPCCQEPYPDVTFYFKLKRKPAFYVTNIIIPSLMITILLVTGFILPVNSGEKVSLEITVMLAMSVFQLLVADKLPPSAEATPWIAIFFNFILGLSGISTILQVIVINIYYQNDKPISSWVLKYIIKPACFITLVNLPGIRMSYFTRDKVDVTDTSETKETLDHEEIWKGFSSAIDRLSLVCFSIVLITGCVVIFDKIVVN